MAPFALLVVFTIVWWCVFFMVLPIGVRPPAHIEAGHDPGAPDRQRLWLKAGITTGIATSVTGFIWAAAHYGWIDFRGIVAP
jgi:predicted secreted protein